ncbi:MAG: hypothetical protein GY788_15700 [bacterium]|nr:hypothetical protein [bacterium]
MAFNLFVIAAAIVIGAGAGMMTVIDLRRRPALSALGTGVLTGVGLSIAALLVLVLWVGPDHFAVIHLVYVVVTLGAPLAGAFVLVAGSGRSTWLRRVMLGLVLLAPVGLYATHVEPFWLRVDRVDVAVVAAPPDTIRIGVLSDLQTDTIGEYEDRAVAALIGEEPDIVLVPGDLWQMSATDFEERHRSFAAVVATLCDAVPHVFIVEGNTDHLEGLKRIAAGTHAIVLDNEVADITVHGSLIRILGLGLLSDADHSSSAYTRFFETADGAAVEPIRIVMAHRPDRIAEFSDDDPIDLYVAGHTHGGQVAIPFFGPPLTLTSVPRSVAAGGLHKVDSHPIYVSTGVGRERGLAPQMRFGVRPSIGVLDLVAATTPTD